MFSLPTHSVGISSFERLGNELTMISIDIYKDTDGYTLVDFTICGQSKHIKTITLISTLSYSSMIQLQSLMLATLILIFTENGRDFGLAVSQTINRHLLQEFLFCTS